MAKAAKAAKAKKGGGKAGGNPQARPPAPIKIIVDNRKARFQYELLEKFEAGIVLTGGEVKSLRDNRVNLGDAYCRINRGELWLHDAHIGQYPHAGYAQHEPLRERKLLMHKEELRRILQKVRQKGFTLIPTKLYFKRGRVKVEFALARGKALHDKRDTIKKRDQEREERFTG